MIAHIGRRTGTRRHVILEIVAQPAAGDYIVASGLGARAQCFRNIRATPGSG